MKNNIGLVPLRNFAVVDKDYNIYRSAQPEYGYEYKWLHNVLGIDTIVNLRGESDHDSVMVERFLDNGIQVVKFDVRDHHEPTLEQCQTFMQLVKDSIAQGKSFLFHCEHGHGRTSTFCVLVRLAMGWTLEDALKEEDEIFHYSFKHKAQKEFLINNFGSKQDSNGITIDAFNNENEEG